MHRRMHTITRQRLQGQDVRFVGGRPCGRFAKERTVGGLGTCAYRVMQMRRVAIATEAEMFKTPPAKLLFKV
jgi:hypothetical protein